MTESISRRLAARVLARAADQDPKGNTHPKSIVRISTDARQSALLRGEQGAMRFTKDTHSV